MGCSESKMEKEEAVARCKDRHHFMKEAVSARNAFAAAHSSYATYLNNTGAALTDFAAQFPTSIAAPAPATNAPSYEIPPPPPLPDFPAPLRRSSTAPEIKMIRPESDPVETIFEEDEDEDVEEEETEPPQQPLNYLVQQEQGDAWEYLFPPVENMRRTTLKGEDEVERRRRAKKEVSAMPVALMKGKSSVKQKQSSVNLVEVFTDLDDHFLKASQAAHQVSRLLEATRLHYHSNFADKRGHIDYSARVMRVVTWNRSFIATPNHNGVKDRFDSEQHETLAMVLDKLLVWEKKLYNEVKAAESMKIEYRKKVVELNKLKKRGTNSEALERAKAIVNHFHTRCIVDMQSLESTVSEISRLRDQLLYPRLVQIVDGMATMWGVMQVHHEQQLNTVMLLGSLDISQSPTETSEHHHDRTYQLLIVVKEWQSQFDKLINNQKEFIKSLNNWLELNLVPIESYNMGAKISSIPSVKSPPIQILLHAWHDHLEKLPEELVRTAIANFAAAVDTILREQEEEMVLKRKCEDTRKEHARKSKHFKEWEYKYNQKRRPDEFGPDMAENNNDPDEVVREKRLLVELLKKRLDEEEEDYATQCLHVRQKSLRSLQNHLPKLFKAMSDFSLECSKMYSEFKCEVYEE